MIRSRKTISGAVLAVLVILLYAVVDVRSSDPPKRPSSNASDGEQAALSIPFHPLESTVPHRAPATSQAVATPTHGEPIGLRRPDAFPAPPNLMLSRPNGRSSAVQSGGNIWPPAEALPAARYYTPVSAPPSLTPDGHASVLGNTLLSSSRYVELSDFDGVNHPSGTAATCIVTSTADSGAGSLRQCLTDATQGTAIGFDPSTFPPATPATINLLSPLPFIDLDDLTIDGSNAGVILNGSGLSDGNGLVIFGADGVAIRGLQILNFPVDGVLVIWGATNAIIGGDRTAGAAPLGQGNLISNNGAAGVRFQDEGTTGNKVLGSYIGTDVMGTTALGNTEGVLIAFGATNNIVGGDSAGERNVISGNEEGIQIQGVDTSGNQVSGNFIGTNATGTASLGNGIGVLIGFATRDNVVGGDSTGKRNLISGNVVVGVQIQSDGTTGNQVLGNQIGTDVTGMAALGNDDGIVIGFGAANNVIGGDTAGARNLISGNTRQGIQIQDPGTTGNQVLGNYIGTNATGMASLGNEDGVLIGYGAPDNIVGGDSTGKRNLISGNNDVGVQLQNMGTAGNQVLGNYIGTDATGMAELGNNDGILIRAGAANNVIGGDSAGAGNLISGNDDQGVQIESEGTSDNRVLGNFIGTDATGTASLGNADGVIFASRATNNVVGGDTSEKRNVISGNAISGIWFQDSGTSGNQVLGNYIGADVTGASPLGNTDAIVIGFGATNNVIGGSTAGARNLISGNNDDGIQIQDVGTSGNRVLGNYIGIDAAGMASLANDDGIVILTGASNNIIGGTTGGAGNVISANERVGIVLQDSNTSDNQVLGNYIGTDATGYAPLGNGWGGVAIILGASDNTVGGNTPGASNLISGNDDTGVWLVGDRTTGNELIGNEVLSNTLHGVYLGDGANANQIGTDNSIAYNGWAGVGIEGVAALGNTITRNSIHSNGDLPIKFISAPVPIPERVLTDTLCEDSAVLPITGRACVGCQVEVFGNPDEEPGGVVFLADTTVTANGDFTATVTCRPAYPYLSATATDLNGTTSEFFPGPGGPVWTQVYLPLIMQETVSSEQAGIYGRVTYNGNGIAGVYLELRFFNGADWSTRTTTATDSHGEYVFTAIPSLSAGQAYYVRYRNGQSGNPDNPNYLFGWYAATITSYTTGERVAGGDFDIADVPLLAPPSGASVTLPAVFRWAKRSITADSYALVIYYLADDEIASTNLLGYVDGVTITGLPTDWPSGGYYLWWLEAHHGDGTENYGACYGTGSATIYYSLAEASSGHTAATLSLSRADLSEIRERVMRLSFERNDH